MKVMTVYLFIRLTNNECRLARNRYFMVEHFRLSVPQSVPENFYLEVIYS